MRPYLIVLFITCGIVLLTPARLKNAAEEPRENVYQTKQNYYVRVVRVVDGDTIKVQFRNGIRDTVRLLGIDTPETSAGHTDPDEFGYPVNEQAKQRLAAWGRSARDWLRQRIDRGDIVRIQFERQEDLRGGYHRLLAYLHITRNGRHGRDRRNRRKQNINKQLIKHGLARVYDTTFQEKQSFRCLEENAIKNRTGLWQNRD